MRTRRETRFASCHRDDGLCDVTSHSANLTIMDGLLELWSYKGRTYGTFQLYFYSSPYLLFLGVK